ncbi:MAG: chemotaxis protein CheC [Alicyclobacillus herbarius]|uniref:chemotaxis protein CheC n=1 Tax=Alicyclobacillus herbarius TaxID=122960 RepID=UPI00041CAAC9|nr:chemotaxis protein CheC [Alicyclobacillus herbarius]MCL6631998.1 chemotaxis protein CheC [Alicyclobacillus herbarius]
MTCLRLSAQQIDALREIGNIGASHAATALSKLLGSPITMKMPSAEVRAFHEIPARVGGEDTVMAGVYIRVDGDFAANFLFLMHLESASRLLSTLVSGADKPELTWDELELSTLGEVANILCASYITAVTNLTHLNARPSVPAMAVDMAGAILDIALLDSAPYATEAVLLQTEIQRGSEDIEGHLVLVPDLGTMSVLLQAVGCANGDE